MHGGAAGPFPDASVPIDGGGSGTGSGSGSGSGSGGGTPGFVSNTPGATLVDIGATPNAVLLSSNVLQAPSGNEVFQQWLGEMKNAGSTLLCLSEVHVTLKNASGIQVAAFDSFADSDPYDGSGGLIIPCIAPGQIGSFYDNGFVPAMADLSSVTRIEVSFSLNAFTATPSLHAPQFTTHVEMVNGEYDVAGMLTGVGGSIHNIGITAYPRDAHGLVLDHLFATDLGQLDPGIAFLFSTIGTASPFTEYRQFADFLDGPATAAPVAAALPATEQGRAIAAVATARSAHAQAVRDRATRSRGM